MRYATNEIGIGEDAILEWIDPTRLAYIKATSIEDARKLGIVPPGTTVPAGALVYVLYDADGQALGFADAWASAYGVARRNELTLMSVH